VCESIEITSDLLTSVHDMDLAAETDKTENMQNSHVSMFMRNKSDIFGDFVGLQATASNRVVILARLQSNLLRLHSLGELLVDDSDTSVHANVLYLIFSAQISWMSVIAGLGVRLIEPSAP
jgi:predicted ATP-binding protein involved in virulence